MHPMTRFRTARPSAATLARPTVIRLAAGLVALLALPPGAHAGTPVPVADTVPAAGTPPAAESGVTPATTDGTASWTDAPFETHGDDHRVREGHVADPADIAADAGRAAAGTVIGWTAAHDALLRARPSPGADAPRSGARIDTTPGTGHPHFATDLDDDTWIADIGVLLRRDGDGDGFFGAVDLSIDVDTTGTERDVYAIIELTESDGTLTLSHVTRTFTVRGNATSDEYRIEIELLDNHRAAFRDVRIDIRDAWSDERLDDVSAFGFASLRALPLEAEHGPADDDGRRPLEQTDYALGLLLTGSSSSGDEDYRAGDAYVAGYAGGAGPLGALALLALALGRRVGGGRRTTGRRSRAASDE